MSSGNKKILLVLLAVAIVGLTYMYVFKPTQEKNDSLESDITSLEARYDELKEKEKNRELYVSMTEEYKVKFDELLAYFPADLDQEVSVMFIKGMVDAYDFDVNSVGLGRQSEFYVLGGAESGYYCNTAAFPISYEGTYDGIQDIMDYIIAYKYRLNISSINITYDAETQMCSGTISLNAYSVAGGDREGDTVNVDVNNGVSNLFEGGAGAPAQSKTYKYDDDKGASIANDYNMLIMLNNPNNDAASGIILANENNDASSYVTSNENNVVDVTVSIYEASGKNYVSYEIGDSSYEFELLSEDLTVYVSSSDRVDSEDKNGVNVTVDNETSIPVFFKVSGEDSTSPRFKLGSKSGVVKVY